MKKTVDAFIGKKPLNFTRLELELCKKLNTKLVYMGQLDYLGRVYTEIVDNVAIKGVLNYWGTHYRDREFKATAKHINLYIKKQSGGIDGTDGIICYSASLKLYGNLKYKYQRGWSEGEICSFYDYDDNLSSLLDRLVEYYNNLLK